MRTLLITGTGFLIGAGLTVPVFFAAQPTPAAVKRATPASAMSHMSGMNSGSSMLASSSLPVRKLTIQHVVKGCHIWSDGKTTAATMRLHMRVGQKLSIMDMDVDAHQMLQFAGPMHLRMAGPMMTNHGMTITFTKRGVYRLGTKTVEMPGMSMDVKTVGPDNKLRLSVTVA